MPYYAVWPVYQVLTCTGLVNFARGFHLSRVRECFCRIYLSISSRLAPPSTQPGPFVETLAKEHPVTIYPGPPSPVRTKPAANRKVIGSTHDLTDQVLTLRINDDSSEGDDDDGVTNVIRAESESHANVITIGDDMHGTLPNFICAVCHSRNSADAEQLFRFFRVFFCVDKSKLSQSASMTSFDNRRSLLISEDDDFSDDSLEHGGLLIHRAPTAIGDAADQPKTLHDELRPFALSPGKCGPGIAWEIKMDAVDEVDRFAKVRLRPFFIEFFFHAIIETFHQISGHKHSKPSTPRSRSTRT